MATKKITDLTELSATPASNDVVAIVDIDADVTKKITISNLQSGISSTPFPFTGDAQITGSLIISGSFIPRGPGVSHISNVSIGQNAGPDLTSTGQENVIIGNNAGNKLDGEDYTVLIGSSAGRYLQFTNGSQSNVIIGGLAGYNLKGTLGVGADAIDGNVFIGFYAGYGGTLTNTDGVKYNIGIGQKSLEGIDGGQGNTTIGYEAGKSISSGDGNIIIGSGSLGTDNPSNQLRIGNGDSFTLISGSLLDGGILIQGQVSASSYIGDGSALTGISAGTNLTQSLFVSPSGNDGTAVVGDLAKPFSTILAATASANIGDTIIVYPGTYTPASQIIKDHVNYYFHPGATVTGSIALMEGTFDNINVRGYGTFDVSGNVTGISVTANGHIEVDKFVIRGITTSNRKRMAFNGSGSGLLELKGTGIAEGYGGATSELFSFGTGEVLADIQAFDNTTIGDVCIDVTGAGTKNINAYAVSISGSAVYISTASYPEAISLTGHFETKNQSAKYAMFLYTGNGADIKIDAHIVGSIYSLNNNNHLTQIHGSQVCSASPSNDAAVSCYNGEHLLNQYLRCSTPTAYYLGDTNGQVTVTGTAQPEGQYKRLMDVQSGKFVWRGTSFNQNIRAESNKIEGTGTVIIDSPLFHFGANYPSNEYAFYLNSADATLEINNKLEYNHDTTGSGVININAGRLVLDGAQIIHGGGTGSYAYAVKLNDKAHSGSIFSNSFTNLTPFGPGSFTNEIVGGGTLFETDKLS